MSLKCQTLLRNMFIGLVSSSAALSGCGKQDGKTTKETVEVGVGTSTTPASSSGETSGATNVYVAARTDLPTCSSAVADAIYYIEDEGTLTICDLNAGDWVDLDFSGSDGANGTAPTAASVFNDDDDVIGSAFSFDGNSLILFSAGGGFANIDFSDGTYNSTIGLDSSGGSVVTTCYFLADGCAGTCYATAGSAFTIMKNAVFFNGTTEFQALGTEADLGAQTFESVYVNGACNSGISSSLNPSYAITNTAPAGLVLPFNGPLYFGLGN